MSDFKNIKKIITDINEIRAEDVFSKQYSEFLAKYREQDNNKNLFVNFSEKKKDIIDKTFSQTPNHNDPIGLYTYPLKEVTQRAEDINYGLGRPYLVVVENVAQENTLYLQDMTEEQVLKYLVQSGMDVELMGTDTYDHEDLVDEYRQRREDSRYSDGGYFFLNIVQSESRSGDNKAQSDFLKSLGIKVLIDEAINKKAAIINPNEPRQALFLTRDSFKILDVYSKNRQHGTYKDITATILSSKDRLAGLIAQELNMPLTKVKYDAKQVLPLLGTKDRGIILDIRYRQGYGLEQSITIMVRGRGAYNKFFLNREYIKTDSFETIVQDITKAIRKLIKLIDSGKK